MAEKISVTPKIESITIELSGDEALALYDVLYRIGGPPDKSRRGLLTSLYKILKDTLGNEITSWKSMARDIEGKIAFFSGERNFIEP